MTDGFVIAFSTGVGAAVGAFVANLFLLFNGARERKAADRRQRRELAIRAATEEYTRNAEIARIINERGRSVKLLPIDTHVIGMIALVEALAEEKRLDEESVGRVLDRMHETLKVALRKTDAYTKRDRDED